VFLASCISGFVAALKNHPIKKNAPINQGIFTIVRN